MDFPVSHRFFLKKRSLLRCCRAPPEAPGHAAEISLGLAPERGAGPSLPESAFLGDRSPSGSGAQMVDHFSVTLFEDRKGTKDSKE